MSPENEKKVIKRFRKPNDSIKELLAIAKSKEKRAEMGMPNKDLFMAALFAVIWSSIGPKCCTGRESVEGLLDDYEPWCVGDYDHLRYAYFFFEKSGWLKK